MALAARPWQKATPCAPITARNGRAKGKAEMLGLGLESRRDAMGGPPLGGQAGL